MRVENTVHPLEVKAGHAEVRAPIDHRCDQDREKNYPTLNRLCSTTRGFLCPTTPVNSTPTTAWPSD